MMIPRRIRYVVIFASTGLVSLLPALTAPVVATPDIAQATGQPCATCHVNPGGGGPRNAFGMQFEALANHDSDPAAAFASLMAAAPAPAAPAPVPAPAAPVPVAPAPAAPAPVAPVPAALAPAAPVPAALAPAAAAEGVSATPKPNPLAPGLTAAVSPVPGVDITAVGAAATIHGDPVAGRQKFGANCASCHGDRGSSGIANPGSDDGTVPGVNPLDPSFAEDSKGDAAIFAFDMDPFLQHGSRPAGPNPAVSMPGFGDHKLLSQGDIADIEAYVMQLNGTFWADRCPGVRLELANPGPGRLDPGTYVMQGRAKDSRAKQGSGIDRVDFFLDNREQGGIFLASVIPDLMPAPFGPGSFQTKVSVPKMIGGHILYVYARSAVTGQESVVSVPIAVGEDPSKAAQVPTLLGNVACTADS
jgi:mono/diheme cytochrome c family protein